MADQDFVKIHDHYMQLAVDEAEKARGLSSPNPHVGAVIVQNDRVVGKGHTQPAGQAHAEIMALNEAGSQCQGADIYVTLEPCSHYGKTPPCADALIKAGIKRVFCGIEDPNPLVNGKGLELLRQAGIEVKVGILNTVIQKQLEVFLTWKMTNKPFVIMKNAVSLDGKIATNTGDSKWISNENSRIRVHKLRSEVDAVITGIQTVLIDDPLFTVRHVNTGKSPIRIILDPYLDLPKTSLIAQTANEYKTLIIKADHYSDSYREKSLKNLGLEIISIPSIEKQINLPNLLSTLSDRLISSVMIESGRTLNSSFLKNKLVNKLYYFIAPKIVGGAMDVFGDLNIEKMKDAFFLDIDQIEKIDEDLLIIGYVRYHR